MPGKDTAVIYHGHASPAKLARCRDALGSVTHGVEWTDPDRMPERDEPYILDNGAYSASLTGDPWSPDRWYQLLAAAHDQPREPDWIVLPDVYGDADATRERHERYVEVARSHGFDYYAVAQPGKGVTTQVRFAEAIGASGVFLGGPEEWKQDVAQDVRRQTDRRALQLHIGQPGNLGWALDIGADSMDTTSIVVNDAYHRLTKLDGQQSLTEVVAGE
ncbi:hypothetical protein [Halobaculum sp. D14]|uniref:hypothetical protein n=1 Tax=Halobaculum sp. D14 TaxID=3421642 RepID=UPI003EB8074B